MAGNAEDLFSPIFFRYKALPWYTGKQQEIWQIAKDLETGRYKRKIQDSIQKEKLPGVYSQVQIMLAPVVDLHICGGCSKTTVYNRL